MHTHEYAGFIPEKNQNKLQGSGAKAYFDIYFVQQDQA